MFIETCNYVTVTYLHVYTSLPSRMTNNAHNFQVYMDESTYTNLTNSRINLVNFSLISLHDIYTKLKCGHFYWFKILLFHITIWNFEIKPKRKICLQPSFNDRFTRNMKKNTQTLLLVRSINTFVTISYVQKGIFLMMLLV